MNRADIERVVHRYRVTHRIGNTRYNQSIPETEAQMIDDLLALGNGGCSHLIPQLSREELDGILSKCYRTCCSCEPCKTIGLLSDKIMAWATGTKTWCDDWKDEGGLWVLQPPSPFGKHFATSEQRFCHICGATRP